MISILLMSSFGVLKLKKIMQIGKKFATTPHPLSSPFKPSSIPLVAG
jgi:hypothetical protein